MDWILASVLFFAGLCWMVCVALGGYISSQKHREPIEGMIFGGILGPIGLIVAALMPTQEAPREKWAKGHPMTRKRQVERDENLPDITNWRDWTANG